MFDIFLPEFGARGKNFRKGLTLSISLLFHAAVITAVIVVPLLRAEASLPGFKVTDAALIAPPVLPGVPPGRSGRPGNGPAGHKQGPKNPPAVSGAHKFLAPVEIPTEIMEEDPTAGLTDGMGSPDGVDGGSGDGSQPWMISDPLKPDEIDVNAVALTTIRPPRLIKRVNPDYSAAAIAARVSGPVVIAAVTDIYGRVREARVVSGHALLSMSALKAVREWIYEPYLVNGIPKPVSFTVTVTFTLENR
jgi:protein TonB